MRTDADALVAAADADPAADLPRLVFADYLDDHAHPVAAEFLRVGVRLSRLVGVSATERKLLAGRRRQLWQDYQREYAAGLAETGTVAADFARGLPNRLVALPARGVLGRTADWWPVPAVRRLAVTRFTNTFAALFADPLLPRLAELALGVRVGYGSGMDFADPVPDEAVLALAGCDRLISLKWLRLGLVSGDPDLLRRLAAAPWAERLPGDRFALSVHLRAGGTGTVLRRSETLLTGRPGQTVAEAVGEWLTAYGDRLGGDTP